MAHDCIFCLLELREAEHTASNRASFQLKGSDRIDAHHDIKGSDLFSPQLAKIRLRSWSI